jgi:hypothetical protein
MLGGNKSEPSAGWGLSGLETDSAHLQRATRAARVLKPLNDVHFGIDAPTDEPACPWP